MKYTVLLTKSNGSFRATVAGLPDCNVTARTRSEALKTVREAISDLVHHSEVVEVDVPEKPKSGNLKETTPWEWAGAFKNDSTWGELFDEIEAQRNSA